MSAPVPSRRRITPMAEVASAHDCAGMGCQSPADAACWLCLGESSDAHPLTRPCKCPTLWSHPVCLGRWQLQSAGKEEERACRFCKERLPQWSQSLSLLKDSPASVPNAVPIMAVVFNGKMVKLPCLPGKEGAELFKQQIRETFHLDQSVNLDVTFELKVPTLADEHKADQKVYLKGFHTFEAASTVAAICAAKRMARKTVQSAPGNAGLSTAGAAAAGAAATAKDTDGSTTPPATAAVGAGGTRPTSAGGSSGGGGSSGAGAMPLGARELQRCRSASPPTLLDPLLELEQEPSLQTEPNLLATTSQQLTSSMPRPRFASVPSLLINTAPAAASYAVASASMPSGGGARASCERPQQQPREHATVLAALPALDMIALANNSSLSEPGQASDRAPVCPRGAGPASPLVCSAAGAQEQQQGHEGRQEQQGHGLQEEASVPRNKSFGKMISQKLRSFFGMASNASSDTRNCNRSGSHGSS